MEGDLNRKTQFWAQNPAGEVSDFIAEGNQILEVDDRERRISVISTLGSIKENGNQRVNSHLMRIWEDGFKIACELATNEKEYNGRTCWILVGASFYKDEADFTSRLVNSIRWFLSEIGWSTNPESLLLLKEELLSIQKRKQQSFIRRVWNIAHNICKKH